MVIVKDDSAPPPYSAALPKVVPPQQGQVVVVDSAPASSSAQPLVRVAVTPQAAGRIARRRFLLAFLWALGIWMCVGLVLGGFGAMNYGSGRAGHGRRRGRDHDHDWQGNLPVIHHEGEVRIQ